MNEALLPFDVMLPSRATYMAETPLMRRSLEQQISQKLHPIPKVPPVPSTIPMQFVPWIDKMMTRLTLITESCSTYENVAEELGIALTQPDVDSAKKAA